MTKISFLNEIAEVAGCLEADLSMFGKRHRQFLHLALDQFDVFSAMTTARIRQRS